MEHPVNDEPLEEHGREHAPFLAHHFDTPQQQFAAGKLGMWLFLVTEILLFGGLFCIYAVYRAHHPEIFVYAAREFLDKQLGAINTAILIFSSFTMAWGVRCAQTNQQGRLIALLIITILCGFGFLGIKFVEYKHKWQEGLLWARQYNPIEHRHSEAPHGEPAGAGAQPEISHPPPDDAIPQGDAEDHGAAEEALSTEPHGEKTFRAEPKNVGVFFSIYFVMTGLHGLHVIIGMAAIGWILRRAMLGHFSDRYFGPVDYVGLYWHLIDLIWIYLFPLLYLID
ncbi:MAG: cytochrome c oxidase subunit 3 family protein [Pirellulaceae bacterium]